MKTYGSNVALKDVSFDLRRGEIVGLLGENGAGKSTLIKILAGVVKPDRGSVIIGDDTFEGTWSPADVRAAGMAFIHQDPALFLDMSVLENVGLANGYPVRAGSVEWASLRERTREILARMSIAADPDNVVGHHSGAVRASIAVAIALADNASVVVLDEPTATLTAHEADRLFEGVRRIRDSGGTVVLVTHRIDEVMGVCDRVVVLRDGALVAEEDVASVSKAKLVEHIVGSEVDFPPVVERRGGDVVLEVLGVATAAQPIPVSFTVERGEVVGLAGPVSAGHEELAAALFGLTSLTTGQFRLHGSEYSPTGIRSAMDAGVGYVPGDRNREGLVFGLTATENLFLGAESDVPRPGTAGEIKEASRVMAQFGVRPNDPRAEITAFSGGNAQKILLARWLRRNPALVILCEPTAGVDVGARAAIYELIAEMTARGTSFIVVSSDFEEVAAIAHRAVVFRPRRTPVELDGSLTIAQISAAALN